MIHVTELHDLSHPSNAHAIQRKAMTAGDNRRHGVNAKRCQCVRIGDKRSIIKWVLWGRSATNGDTLDRERFCPLKTAGFCSFAQF